MMPPGKAPVVTGEWECTECGFVVEGRSGLRPPRCPDCGAPAAALEFRGAEDDWEEIDEDEPEDNEDDLLGDDFDEEEDEYDDFDDEEAFEDDDAY